MGHLGAGLTSQTMGLLHLLPLLALSVGCHGAALPEAEHLDLETIMDTFQDFVANPSPYMEAFGVRAKRHAETEDHTGFKEFPIPFLGAEVGVKYKDNSDHLKGGEAYLHIDDLQSHIPEAHSKMVKIHVKFDGGASTADGLFNFEVDYHLEHKDGDGIEEGSLTIVREQRGGKWHTNIKTEAHPFSGVTIIPTRISNMQLDIESDRLTTLSAKYFNGPMDRDLTINIVRVPGKSIKAIITNKGVTSTIEGILTKPSANEIDVKIDADIRGTKYTGVINGKVDIKKGAESVLQVVFELKSTGSNFKFRGKYSVMGGKVAQGNYSGKYENGKLEVEGGPYKVEVELKLGESIVVKVLKGGVEMWTYSTLRGDKSTANAIIYEAHSEMTLNPESILHGLIEKNYPFGAFRARTNTFKITIDKHERNILLRKFKLEFDITKDGLHVLDIVADTTVSPYNFNFRAPNLFRRLHINQEAITVTVDHVRGSHLIIDANVGGGVHVEARQTPNSLGGRTIDILTSKAGVEMLTYHADTSKVDTAAMFKVGLKGELTLNPESLLYRTVVGKYQFLTPFRTRSSDLEFMVDRVNKNAFLNKFHAKAKVDKDSTNVLNLEISTDHQPYKFHIFCPAIFGKLRSGMTEVDVTVDHVLGQHLYLEVHHAGARWKGFKISKTGSGNEREIEWNGRKLGSGDYTLTDNSFSTTQTLADGKSLTTTITWKNKWDTVAFLLDNAVSVKLDGTERRLDLDVEWGMNKVPDMNFNTAENGHFKAKAVGHNARWGDYSDDRDVTWSSGNRRLTAAVRGTANFGAGALHASSPIVTDMHFTYDLAAHDLEGTFKKVLAGKEYSITFPRGSFKMPSIKIGA